MRLKEQRLYDTLLRNLSRKEFWIQRIENVLVPGMPDLHIAAGGNTECWVELKAPTAKARRTSLLLGTEGLNPDQVNWHLKAESMGVLSYVLVRPDRTQELFLFEGGHASEVNEWDYECATGQAIAHGWGQVRAQFQWRPR